MMFSVGDAQDRADVIAYLKEKATSGQSVQHPMQNDTALPLLICHPFAIACGEYRTKKLRVQIPDCPIQGPYQNSKAA
jgi:hypothetical protein